MLPWQTEVDGNTWQVRLNDFPDEPMYTLLSGGQALGSSTIGRRRGAGNNWFEIYNRRYNYLCREIYTPGVPRGLFDNKPHIFQ